MKYLPTMMCPHCYENTADCNSHCHLCKKPLRLETAHSDADSVRVQRIVRRLEWITLSAERFHIGNCVTVTGGKIWAVAEDPRKDWDHLPRNEHGTLVFINGGEVRESIRSRKEDLEVWTS